MKANALAIGSTASPGVIIMEHLQKLAPRLLVMGAYSKAGWRDFLFGSTTRALLKNSPAPVFLSH